MSLLEEITNKNKSFNFKKYRLPLIIVLGIALIAGGIYYFSGTTAAATTTTKAETSYDVKKGDIKIGVSADGVIKTNNLVNLGFKVSEKLTHINKKVGDNVSVGDVIAQVDDRQLQLDLSKSENNLTQQESSYVLKKNPLSDDQKSLVDEQLNSAQLAYNNKILTIQKDLSGSVLALAQAKLKLQQSQDELARQQNNNNPQLKQDEQVQMIDQKEKDLNNKITDLTNGINDFLYQSDRFLGLTNGNSSFNDAYETYIGAKVPATKYQTNSMFYDLYEMNSKLSSTGYTTSGELIKLANSLNDISAKTKDFGNTLLTDVKNSISSPAFNDSDIKNKYDDFYSQIQKITQLYSAMDTARQSYISSFTTAQSTLNDMNISTQNTISSLQQQVSQNQLNVDSAQQDLDSKIKEYDIAVQSNKSDLEMAKLDAQNKLNPLSPTEDGLYQAQIDSAKLDIQQKELALENATLRSPVSGTIISITNNIGEYPSSPFAAIAIQGFTYVEVYVAQEDINKIKVGEDTTISVNSADNLSFTGKVYYVSSVGKVDNNSIVSYQVLIAFENNHPEVKDAMNVSVEFITKEVKNVVIIPFKAIQTKDNMPYVKMESGELRKIIGGFSDGKNVEIISGLSVGEKVLVEQ